MRHQRDVFGIKANWTHLSRAMLEVTNKCKILNLENWSNDVYKRYMSARDAIDLDSLEYQFDKSLQLIVNIEGTKNELAKLSQHFREGLHLEKEELPITGSLIISQEEDFLNVSSDHIILRLCFTLLK